MKREQDHSKYQNWIDPNEVRPYERNVKIHTDKQVANIARSIKKFGWQQDTVITRDKVLVIGHGRRLAALKLGCEMPYHVVDKDADELTDKDIRELRIADNLSNSETGYDFDLGAVEIADLEFDGFDFDLSEITNADHEWFSREERDGTARQEGNDEYNEFLDKFEEKKTTDDCYTPDNIYEAIADWIAEKSGTDKKNFKRPFYPGGDYQSEKYPKNCAVVDNPPFSILAEIVDFYVDKGIKFFLFAPALVLLNYITRDGVAAVAAYVGITYENGANIKTGFLTNMLGEDIAALCAPDLFEIVDAINTDNEKAMHRDLPKYDYPFEVLTSAKMGWMAEHGSELVIKKADCCYIRSLDAQKESGGGIFGGAMLLSERAAAERAAAERAAAERAAAERAAAERAAAERAAATVWQLSERERKIVESLGQPESRVNDK